MRGITLLLLSGLLVLSAGCDKPEADQCRKACWNYMKLRFWENVDAEVEGKSPEEAAKIRAQRELDFKEIQERQEDPGHQNCMMECQQKANKEQVKCLIEAGTVAKADACIKG